MDASYKIQRGIHVHLIQFFMCPEFWVHIIHPSAKLTPSKMTVLFRWITSTSMAVTMKPSMRSNPWHVVFTRNSSLNDRKE